MGNEIRVPHHVGHRRASPTGAKPRSRATILPPAEIFTKDIYPPAQPVGLQAVFSSVGQKPFVDLTWAPNSETDVAGYNVFRRSAGGEWQKLNQKPVPVPSFRDETVQPGTKYQYSVSAVDLRGNESQRSAADIGRSAQQAVVEEGLRDMKICRFQHAGNIGYGLIEEVAGTSTITRSLNHFPAGAQRFRFGGDNQHSARRGTSAGTDAAVEDRLRRPQLSRARQRAESRDPDFAAHFPQAAVGGHCAR